MTCPTCRIWLGSPCVACRTYSRIGWLLQTNKLKFEQGAAVTAALRLCSGALLDLSEEALRLGPFVPPAQSGVVVPAPTAPLPPPPPPACEGGVPLDKTELVAKLEEEDRKDKKAAEKKDKKDKKQKKKHKEEAAESEKENPTTPLPSLSSRATKEEVEAAEKTKEEEEIEVEEEETDKRSKEDKREPLERKRIEKKSKESSEDYLNKYVRENPRTFQLGILPERESTKRRYEEGPRGSGIRPRPPPYPPNRGGGKGGGKKKKKSKGKKHWQRGRDWKERFG